MHPAHKPFLVIQRREGEFFIDHVVCFGIASGVGLQGRVMDALVDILDALEMGPNRKWVDDLWNMRYPVSESAPGAYLYGHDVSDIFALSKIIRVPWSESKVVPHAFSGTYSGFRWDLPNKTVSLPEEKRFEVPGETVGRSQERARRSCAHVLETSVQLEWDIISHMFCLPTGPRLPDQPVRVHRVLWRARATLCASIPDPVDA